mgnify:CR=1 FL=1
MNREEAWKLLTEYNKESFHLRHALTVEGIMRYFAKELGYGDQEEYWGNVGLLHDLDFELYPEEHCVKSQELMRAHNVDESIIRSTASHGYGLTAANIAPEQVDHINAHGTGTHMNDACETAAIHAVFGAHAKEMTVVSTKSMTGHLLGGAGGIEAVFTALALRDQFAPPTIHYAQPDPECDLDYVPNTGRQQEMQYALSNSLGFGGHNACIALRRWEG